MSTETAIITPEIVKGLIDENKLVIQYNKYPRKDTKGAGITYYTMIVSINSRPRQLKFTIGPTTVIKGPWPERKYINADIQIGIDSKAGAAFYALAKYFEQAYNNEELNVRNKKPRSLTLPIYPHDAKEGEQEVKVKIALGFTDSGSRFKLSKLVMHNNEVKKENIDCDSKNVVDIIRSGSLISGDIVVTYNTHPSRGLALCFEAKELVIKQVMAEKSSILDVLTEEEKRMMIDDTSPVDSKVPEKNTEPDDTIQAQLDRLELSE
jgi:hypothetical protein